jgi:molecular chaperone HscB
MPAQFLMQQMEWREALDDASTVSALESLSQEMQATKKLLLQQCAALIDESQDFSGAVAPVRALMFIEKFAIDLNHRIDQLE